MNPSTPLRVAGVDVGKSHLDAHILDGGHERRFDNTKVGRRALRNWLLKHGVVRVVFEPTGRFHRNLHQCLGDAGLQTVLVNSLRSRRFAEAIGVLAKNDRVDAAMLARFVRLDGLEGTPPPSRNLVLLSDLLALRRKLVEQLAALRKLRDELDPELRGGADAAVDGMRDAIADYDGRMRACIAADADSGGHRGARHVRGGRAAPRALLFMAATTAIRRDPGCGAYHARLVARGKSHKVAVVAVMRRLVTLLTALLREDRLWLPEARARTVEAAA